MDVTNTFSRWTRLSPAAAAPANRHKEDDRFADTGNVPNGSRLDRFSKQIW
jgi:hypothetical protein